MQIGVPTQCMTGGQENSGDEQIPTAKYDANCCFLPDYFVYLRSYLVGQIKIGF